jgi:hypothetical protein
MLRQKMLKAEDLMKKDLLTPEKEVESSIQRN